MQTDQAAVQTQEAGCCSTLSQKQVVQAENQQKIMLLKMLQIQSLGDQAGWHLDFDQMLGSGQHQTLDWQMVLKVQCQRQRRILEVQRNSSISMTDKMRESSRNLCKTEKQTSSFFSDSYLAEQISSMASVEQNTTLATIIQQTHIESTSTKTSINKTPILAAKNFQVERFM